MQFKVPQNIDMEDKIVGPLTLVQFLYLLGGGLIVYVLFQSIGGSAVFFILALPIAIVSLAMAFIKIQDQPLSHFVKAGLAYFSRPKVRYWKKDVAIGSVLVDPPKKVANEGYTAPKKIEKSDLEKLAHVLDTGPLDVQEKRNFGSITNSFEKMIQQGMNQQKTNRGGQVGTMGQKQATGK